MDWETNLLQENIPGFGDIKLLHKKFGLFSRVVSQGIRIKDTCTISGLFGRNLPPILQPTLTLTGHVGSLVLYEGSSIDGYIVLHHGEIYRNRRGRPLSEYQNRLIIRESPSLPFDSTKIPLLFDKFSTEYQRLLRNKNAISGNMHIDKNTNDSILQQNEIIVLGDCYISSGSLVKTKLAVSGKIHIQNSAIINESELYSAKLIVDGGVSSNSLFYSLKTIQIKGGNHNSQFFARDSISIAKQASFDKFNTFVSYREMIKDNTVSGGIVFESGSEITGTVISCLDPLAKKILTGASITIGKKSSLIGVIVTDHDLDINEITIKGHVWARSIVARNEKQSFVNYLISSTIEQPEHSIPFPLVGLPPVKMVFQKATLDFN